MPFEQCVREAVTGAFERARRTFLQSDAASGARQQQPENL